MDRIRYLHVVDTAVIRPELLAFADNGDRTRFECAFATLSVEGIIHEEIRRRGVPALGLQVASRRDLATAAARLATVLRRRQYHVVQAHLLNSCLVALSAARLAGVPIRLFTAHHSHEPEPGERKPTWLLDRFARAHLATAIVAPSRWMASRLVEELGEAPDRVEVINHGLEPANWNVEEPKIRRVRAELDLGNGPVLVTIGRLHPLKNLEALVEAFALIHDTAPRATLVVVGGSDFSSLKELAARLGVAGAVRFPGQRRDVPALLAAADLYVSPALRESFNLALLEAMRMGLPALATPTGIAPEIVSTGANGVLVDGTGPRELAAGLSSLLADRDRWEEMGRESARRARPFTTAATVAAHERLYERLVSSASTRSRRDGWRAT